MKQNMSKKNENIDKKNDIDILKCLLKVLVRDDTKSD